MKTRTLLIMGKLQQIVIGRPRSLYSEHNCCAECNLWYPKSLGRRCPECNRLARQISPYRQK